MCTKKYQKINKKTYNAFTLIEMIIGIFILGVGILVIVSLLTTNISRTRDIHIRNTATILAREGIELSYNYRNTNELLGYKRNCIRDNQQDRCSDYLYTGDNQSHRYLIEGGTMNHTYVEISKLGTQSHDDNVLRDTAKLYLQKDITDDLFPSIYTHNASNGDATIYARYLEFAPLTGLSMDSPIDNSLIHHLSSIVLFNTNTQIKKIELESFIAQQF